VLSEDSITIPGVYEYDAGMEGTVSSSGFFRFPKEVNAMPRPSPPHPENSGLTPHSLTWSRNRRVGSREKGI
jgi:hypothetical protein